MQGWPQDGPGPADRPTPDQVRAWQRQHQPPSNEIGVTVPLDLVLGRTNDVAVVLTNALVHTTGLLLTVAARGRVPLVLSPGGLGQVPHKVLGDGQTDSRLMLGVEFADGRRASNLLPRRPPGVTADDRHPMLALIGGNGVADRYDARWWLRPLPPVGPVRVVCAWPVHDLPETITQLNGDQLQAAASQVQVLWEPVDVPMPQQPERPLPASGWFSSNPGEA